MSGYASHSGGRRTGTRVELVDEEAGELVLADEGESLEKILSCDNVNNVIVCDKLLNNNPPRQSLLEIHI